MNDEMNDKAKFEALYGTVHFHRGDLDRRPLPEPPPPDPAKQFCSPEPPRPRGDGQATKKDSSAVGEEFSEARQPVDGADLTLPDRLAADPDLVQSLKPLMTGLAREKVDALLDLHAQALDLQAERFEQQVARWAEEVENDPELDDAAISSAQGLVRRFGSKELSQLLAASGLGNNKHVIRMLARVAREMEGES